MKTLEEYARQIEIEKKLESDFYQKLIQDEKSGLLDNNRRLILNIFNAFHKKEKIEITILKFGKGGFIVELLGIQAFLPYSASYINRNSESILGSKLDANVIKVKIKPLKIIVARHLIVEKEFNGKELLLSHDIEELNQEQYEDYKKQSEIYFSDEEIVGKAKEELYNLEIERKRRYKGEAISEGDIMQALDDGFGYLFGYD